jgi:hypothetical protein
MDLFNPLEFICILSQNGLRKIPDFAKNPEFFQLVYTGMGYKKMRNDSG